MMELFATDGAMLLFKALFLCILFLVFFLLAWGLSKLIDMFIEFFTSDE